MKWQGPKFSIVMAVFARDAEILKRLCSGATSFLGGISVRDGSLITHWLFALAAICSGTNIRRYPETGSVRTGRNAMSTFWRSTTPAEKLCPSQF